MRERRRQNIAWNQTVILIITHLLTYENTLKSKVQENCSLHMLMAGLNLIL